MKRRIYLVGFRVDGVKHVKEVVANNKQSALDKFNKSNPNVPIESIIFSQWVDLATMTFHDKARFNSLIF